MTEVRWDGLLEPLVWGRNVYTVLRVPPALAEAAAAWPTRRVEGRLDDVEVNLGLNQAEAGLLDGPFLYVGSSLQRRLGLRAGDLVECRLRPADPDAVPLPDDVREALETAGRAAAWERLRPAERRRRLVPVDGAARPATRARRVAALVAELPPG